MNKNTIFSTRLKTAMLKDDIKQSELANITGLTEVTISRYVNNQRTPKATDLVKIANALSVSCDYLLGNDKPTHQIIRNLGDKLTPCPFCGRKMIFHKHTYTNKYGTEVTQQYYTHEKYNIFKDESCILDELEQPFEIQAGDANPETGYIGEYAEKWNKQLENQKKG